MKDLTMQRFGRLVAIKPVGTDKWGNYRWLCKCDCGNEKIIKSSKLVQGRTRSCGCYRKEVSTKSLEKHGITTGGKPRTFIIWGGMKARCYNSDNSSYKSYGARGITVCKEWLIYKNFHNWAINNGYSDELEIDRIDNNGNYEPSNCRWVSKNFNRKHQRKTRWITIGKTTDSINGWCKKYNINKWEAYKYLNKSEESFKRFIRSKGQIYFTNKFLRA